jgi:hypothetical protein
MPSDSRKSNRVILLGTRQGRLRVGELRSRRVALGRSGFDQSIVLLRLGNRRLCQILAHIPNTALVRRARRLEVSFNKVAARGRIPPKRMAIWCTDPRAEIRMGFRCLPRRHLSVVF